MKEIENSHAPRLTNYKIYGNNILDPKNFTDPINKIRLEYLSSSSNYIQKSLSIFLKKVNFFTVEVASKTIF